MLKLISAALGLALIAVVSFCLWLFFQIIAID
jgi:hypothetical protein